MRNSTLKKTALSKLSTETWVGLYAAAAEVFALKPWEIIPPDILLKTMHPLTGEPVFGSIMGEMGEVFGVSIQSGKWAEYSLMKAFAEGEEELLVANFHRVLSFKIEFVKKVELSGTDKDRLKALAYKPPGGAKGACWPMIEVMKEGCVQCPPDVGDADIISELLPRFILMVRAIGEHAGDSPDRLPEGIAVWPEGRTVESPLQWDEIEWRPFETVPEPVCEVFPLDEFTAARLKELPQVKQQIELDAFAGFASVGEGERAFFMKLGLALDTETEMVVGLEVGTSGTDLLENIVGRLLVQVVSKLKARPTRILLSQKSLLEALRPVAEKLRIELRHQKHLPALEQARASMPEHFGV